MNWSDPEQVRAYHREWRRKKGGAHRESQRAWRAANRDRNRELQREWRHLPFSSKQLSYGRIG